ncbi:hypothetical protein E3E23_04985 [Thermococcus sp. CX2]|uniref:hypothetical protein n=1 Tax=Thermococcus sp. CX2 TaxID=163006 RepID=UPI00143B10A5|nr:hypothetical protein [Thermococcus sp. CX2]NJE85183.1 hypothetical protein [Thermococcus sp. CX2]
MSYECAVCWTFHIYVKFVRSRGNTTKIASTSYIGNTAEILNTDDLDGYVVIYTAENPLVIWASAVTGFNVSSP